ncbi:MAG: bifunctional 4-hydroxy-2-oxoglutarate aldolase/2-dehydro-3-deoxy-phosphogluconate aldolase [Euzebyales bacterium]|nr:bifunctional 4-hydroxy-2-oxoglutarate aldolase/2-dehydro-3-deoxy-phosphogluconate aldolase [Euzebyales bacterium]
MNRPPLPAAIREGRVVAIARGLAPPAVVTAAAALRAAGVRAVEVTLDSPDALTTIHQLVLAHGDAVAVGAGTVGDIPAAEAAAAAGATYLVAPHFDAEVVRWAAERGLPALPGALTATEVVSAWNAGAAAVKIFPAGALGPAYLRALAEPLRHVALLPTGGVDDRNAADFLAAGAVAVGVGGWLLGDGEPDGVGARARSLCAAVASTDRTGAA